jgi:hypothetical protein
MKLQNEFETVKKRFADNLEKIKDYAPRLKANGDYNDFEKRLTFDCLRAFIGTQTMCEWYDKYECNDNHIYTLGKKALKELKII